MKRAPEGEPLVLSWWARHRPRRRHAVVGAVDAADLLPDPLPRKALVIVGTDKRPTWVGFVCPCERHHTLLLPLATSRTPHWVLRGDRRPTLHPSVDSHDGGQRCHFWLKDGRIQWVGRPR